MQIRKSSILLGATVATLGALLSTVNADSVTVPNSVANLKNGSKNFLSTVQLNMNYKGANPHSNVASGTFVGENKIITTASNFLHLVDGKPQFIGDDSSIYKMTTPAGLTQTFQNKDIHFINKDGFGDGPYDDIAVIVLPGYKRTSESSELVSYPSLVVSNGDKVSVFGMDVNGFNALVEQPIRKIEKTKGGTLVSYGEGLQSPQPGLKGGGIFNADGKLIGIHRGTTPHEVVDGVIFTQPQLDEIKEIVNANSPESTVTTTKPIVTVYEEDPELEGGKERVDIQGIAEVVDVAGKIITPGQPTVIKKGTKGSTTRVEKPFSITYEDDPTLPFGETRTKSPGTVGYTETIVSYTFDKTLNKITRSEVVNKVAPINEVRLRGTHVESIPNPNNVGAAHVLSDPVAPKLSEIPIDNVSPKPVVTSSDTNSDANRIPNPNNVGASHVLSDPVVPKLPETPTNGTSSDANRIPNPNNVGASHVLSDPVVPKLPETPIPSTVTKPVETPTVNKPVEVDKPTVNKPTPTVNKPVETPTVNKPVETPTVNKPTDKPVETPTVNKPTDKPVETPTVNKPVETPTVNKPVEVDKPTRTNGDIKYSNVTESKSKKTLPKTGMGSGFGLVGLLTSVIGSMGLKKRKK